jgi:aspartate racemase
MKTLGLIGGTGWVSTLEYYRLLNEGVARRLGGHEAARCIVYSFNVGDVMRAKEGDPEQTNVREMVIHAAGRLAAAGADGLLLCANTLHWFADAVERAVPLPLAHIATATGNRIRAAGLSRIGLLGTRPTMERRFYRQRLEGMGIEVIARVPRRHRRVAVAGRAGGGAGLHRNPAAGETGGLRPAALRHAGDPRRGGGGLRPRVIRGVGTDYRPVRGLGQCT